MSENIKYFISSLNGFESDESIFRIIEIGPVDFTERFVLLEELRELFFPLRQLTIQRIQFLLVDIFDSCNSFISYCFTSISC